MCFRKRKSENIAESKYKIGQFVRFNYNHDVRVGSIVSMSKDDGGNILYVIQLGGECPSYVSSIPESKIFLS